MNYFTSTALCAALFVFASNVVAQDRIINGQYVFGCISKDDYSSLIKILASGDDSAFENLLARHFASGRCKPLKSGAPAYTEDASMFSGMIKVRIQGETTGYWTTMESTKSF